MDFKNQVLIRLDNDSPKVESFVEVIQGVQDTFITIGRYFEGGATTGRLPDAVRDKCTLSIKNLKMSSPPEAILSVPATQQISLTDEAPILDTGERSVELFLSISELLSGHVQQSAIETLIRSPEHRVNILKSYTKMIPDQYPIQISSPRATSRFLLDGNSKNMAVEMTKRSEEQVVQTEGVERIIGPVIEARISDIVYFMIGNKKYVFDEDQEEAIREMLGRVVSLDASVKKVAKNRFYVSKIINLDVVNEWTFSAIKKDGGEIELSKPVSTTVFYQDNAVWLIDKEELGIVGAGKTWDDAFEDFMFTFRLRLLGYVGKPDEELTDDAIVLRDRLRNLVPSWREVLTNGGKQ